MPDQTVFDRRESEVQSYARSFPTVFRHALGCWLEDVEGRRYLDFLAGAGSLNYGHNHPVLKQALIDYLSADHIVHSLDLHTCAKQAFLETLETVILRPRQMPHRVQFTGPTGTNAVEAALKIARNVTGRSNILSFTNGFHGVSLGSLAVTGNSHHRDAAGLPLHGASVMPYYGYLGPDLDTLNLIDRQLQDSSSGVDLPAAVIVETVQGEGGINVAGMEWLRALEALCRKHDMLLIVDDIQAGCGRTGHFFSFEEAGIAPDIITLSKSLSGYGLPLSVVLLKPELDQWKPGEHNGTFRGHNPAFVTATAALNQFWRDSSLTESVQARGDQVQATFMKLCRQFPELTCRGRGLMQGLEFPRGEQAAEVTRRAFTEGLIVETSGADGQVVKVLCPLTIQPDELAHGLSIIARCTEQVLAARQRHSA